MVSARILRLPTAPRDLARAQSSRLTNAEVARRARARKKKCAANTGVDFDGPILELLIRNHVLSRAEAADDSAKGLRKIGEAMYRYLSAQARKEIC
jgi:hypothetical protein